MSDAPRDRHVVCFRSRVSHGFDQASLMLVCGGRLRCREWDEAFWQQLATTYWRGGYPG
jgi:hypothetical protein